MPPAVAPCRPPLPGAGLPTGATDHRTQRQRRSSLASIVVVLGLGSGCGADTSAPLPARSLFPSAQTGPGALASADSGDAPPASPPPLWSADQVGTSLSELFVGDVPNGGDLMELFTTLARSGDADCPGADLAFTTPESSCTSSTGWEYFGFCDYVDLHEDVDGATVRVRGIVQASFVITAPDGRTFSAGGGFVHETPTDGSGDWAQSFTGTYVWTGDGYPWLQAGTQVGWTLEGRHADSGDTLSVHGPIGVGTSWAFVDRIDWDETRCDGVPEVELRVRDTHGRWYDWSAGADCAPCGPVTHTDPEDTVHERGELCLDLTDTMRSLSDHNAFPESG